MDGKSKRDTCPGPTAPRVQRDVDFMVKDSNRFPDGGGWGYAFTDYGKR